jgi:hypothetical protein
MKKLLVVSALLLSSTTLFSTANAQQVRFVSSDGSELSALCIAVASSNLPLSETLAAYGIERKEITEIRCNGIELSRFVSKFKQRNLLGQKNYQFGNESARATTSLQ